MSEEGKQTDKYPIPPEQLRRIKQQIDRYPIPPEQLQRIKQIDLYTYLEKYRPDEIVHLSGDEYYMKSHDSLKFNKVTGEWHRWSTGDGGHNALKYLEKVEGIEFLRASKILAGLIDNYIPIPQQEKSKKPKEKTPFKLPAANFTNNVIMDYLCKKRSLPKELVLSCIQKKLIYESQKYHNVVFVGYDKEHKARYATLRGCYDKPFRMDAEGSNKAYSFSIPAKAESASKTLYVFESAIDALSFSALKRVGGVAHLLSLAGVAPPKSNDRKMRKLPVALEQYLKDYPEIQYIGLCLDNDGPGRAATREITRLLGEQYTVYDMPSKIGKDYNDELVALRSRSRNDFCR